MIELSHTRTAASRGSARSPLHSPPPSWSRWWPERASIALWRGYTGTSPEPDRVVAVRQLQARTAQASEQLVEKTKGLEATQQESIDQLQVVQDQLQTVRRLLAAQQSETRQLSEQVGSLTGAIDGLRQSFASAQTSEPSSPPSVRKSSVKKKRSAVSQRKRAKSRG